MTLGNRYNSCASGPEERGGFVAPIVSLWPPLLNDDFEQADPGHGPMPTNRGLTDPKRFGYLLMLQADEIAHLHDLRLHRIFLGQHVEGFIHFEELLILERRGNSGVALHALQVSTAFE